MTPNEAVVYVISRNPPPGFLEVIPLSTGKILVAEIRRLTEQRTRLFESVDEWAMDNDYIPDAVEDIMEEIDSENEA